jgi:AcrR family transcriptional regulator
MARTYRLGKRAATSAATRQRIVESARSFIFGDGFELMSMGAIANAAGVTRSTIYEQFGSRDELVLAVVNDALDRAQVRQVRKALQRPDAAVALRGLMPESCRFWAGDYALFSRIKALAAADPAVAAVDRTKERVRLGHITNITQRLHDQGLLRKSMPHKRALATLHLLTSYEVFDQLYRGSQRSLPQVISILTDLAEQSLLVEPGAS